MATTRPTGISLSPSSVEAATKLKPHLDKYASRLKNLDKDNNQVLDLEEICEAMDEIVELEKQRRLLKWIALFLGIFSLLVTAATVGLTFAVLELSKDTKVTNNVFVTKDGETLSIGKYHLDVGTPDGTSQDITVIGGTLETVNGTRRLLQSGQSNAACYRNYGRVEDYSINAICDRVNGNDPTFILRLKSRTCRTKADVEVTINDDAEWVAKSESGEIVCPYQLIEVKVSRHFCHVLGNQQMACKQPIDDVAKAAKTWTIVYGASSSTGNNYQIDYKANCGSVDNPKFQSWFLSGDLRTQIECPPNTNNGNSNGENSDQIVITDGPITILPSINLVDG